MFIRNQFGGLAGRQDAEGSKEPQMASNVVVKLSLADIRRENLRKAREAKKAKRA